MSKYHSGQSIGDNLCHVVWDPAKQIEQKSEIDVEQRKKVLQNTLGVVLGKATQKYFLKISKRT